MSDWRRGTLGELAKGHRGVTYAAGQLLEFGAADSVTLLRSNNINAGRLNYDDVQVVPNHLVTEEQILRLGDLAVCMSNGSKALVGKAAMFSEVESDPHTVGAFCSVFRPEPSCVPEFVSHVFQSKNYRINLELALAGTAISNLRNRDVEAFVCEIPPEDDQRVIAKVLGTLDTAIHETEAIIAKLKAVKQGLLHDLLTRGIDANGELRPPQSDAPHLYKSSLLGWIPKGWDYSSLESMVSNGSPITYGVVQPGPEVEDGIPFVRGGDIWRGRILVDQLRTISETISSRYQRTRLLGGEILMSLVGYPGEVGVVPDSLAGANIARQAALIRLPNSILSRFVKNYLSSVAGKKQVLGQSLGSAQQVVNLGDLRNVKVPFPGENEMHEISERAEAIGGKLDEEADCLEKLRISKSGLMDDLLTGRVRVTPLLDAASP